MNSKIKRHEFKKGLKSEFEFLDLKQVFLHPKEELAKLHRLNFFSIVWFTEGIADHVVDFNPIAVKPNTVLFLRQNAIQAFDIINPYTGKAALFTESFFCKSENDTTFLRNSLLFNDLISISKIQLNENEQELSKLFKMMENEFTLKDDPYSEYILKNLLQSFLLLAEREFSAQNTHSFIKNKEYDLVVNFKNAVEKNYRETKSVKIYAERLQINYKTLNTACEKVLGQTSKSIINNRIILETKRMLTYSKENINEISFHLGYSEPTYFIHFFKKQTGLTPLEFRNKNIEG